MKKFVAAAAFLAIAFLSPLAAVAQDDNKDHFSVGAFADYVRLKHANNTNFWGVGGRVGFGLAPHINLEAEMAYDFEQNVTNTITTTGTTGVTTTFTRGGLRLWHGTFGPMVWFGSKHARVFGVVKGGFLNFSTSGASPTSGFTNAVATFGSGDTNGVFYPGGGAEVSVGPIGFRVDVGDLMYIDRGANHNLSIKFGPTLRF